MASLKSSNVDTAIALVVPGTVDSTGGILELGAGGGAGAPAAGAGAPSVGEHVAKSGRSTGLTCSTVSSVNTTAKVDYQPSCNQGTTFTVTFRNQIVISGGSFSASGDSGALVVDSDTAVPIGLLYAGSSTDTVANPINDVLHALSDPSTGDVPSVVGGAQHSVPCTSTQSASAPQAGVQPVSADAIQHAANIKLRHERDLLRQPGVLAVGLGASATESGKPVLVIYTDKNQLAPSLPKTFEGLKTRIVRSEHFRAFGWNEKVPAACAKPAH
jgi:hypothetical protein